MRTILTILLAALFMVFVASVASSDWQSNDSLKAQYSGTVGGGSFRGEVTFVDSGIGQMIVTPMGPSAMSGEMGSNAMIINTDTLTRFLSCDQNAMLDAIRVGQTVNVHYHASQTGVPVANLVTVTNGC